MSKNKKKSAIFLGGPNHLQVMPLNPEKHTNILLIPVPRKDVLSVNQAQAIQKLVPVQRAEYIFEGIVTLQEEIGEGYAIYNFSGYS